MNPHSSNSKRIIKRENEKMKNSKSKHSTSIKLFNKERKEKRKRNQLSIVEMNSFPFDELN